MAKILVIDDDISLLQLIKNALEYDHSITTYTGLSSVSIREINKHDLLILDVMMPELDGFTFLKEKRREIDIPVLFLTAKSFEQDLIEGFSIGADDYIVKPFAKEVLLTRVEMHIARSAQNLRKTVIDMQIQENRKRIQEKLTPVEWKVALAVAQGMENKEIAEQMNYSYGYIKNVITRIFLKLDIEKRRELRKLLIG